MKILLIEDNIRLGEQLKPEIERSGYGCFWARDMKNGLRAFYSEDPDLILLDLMLPDGSGLDLLQTVRQTSNVPIIVITAKVIGEGKVRALDLGADDYVTKPFWTNELTARIRAVMRRHRFVPQAQELHKFGVVTVDLISRVVHVDGAPCHLTPTEFDLLNFFLKRPRQALRRERIIDAVFNNEDAATEALQTHISRLRKKLGDDGAHIQTVWGIGYRFDGESDSGS